MTGGATQEASTSSKAITAEAAPGQLNSTSVWFHHKTSPFRDNAYPPDRV